MSEYAAPISLLRRWWPLPVSARMEHELTGVLQQVGRIAPVRQRCAVKRTLRLRAQ